jgi:hypothetical protein
MQSHLGHSTADIVCPNGHQQEIGEMVSLIEPLIDWLISQPTAEIDCAGTSAIRIMDFHLIRLTLFLAIRR